MTQFESFLPSVLFSITKFKEEYSDEFYIAVDKKHARVADGYDALYQK